MFTGIISGVGRIAATTPLGADGRHGLTLTLDSPAGYLDDVALGDSIALNGACMTVTSLDAAAARFTIDISAESLSCTAGLDRAGPRVNLEKALRANDRLGGHLVSGHVDGVGTVMRFEPVGESFLLEILAPRAIGHFLAYKGSVTVNGVSLTVNRVQDESNGTLVAINLIPHTVQNTALCELARGGRVNLEIDLLARYVERMLTASSHQGVVGHEDTPAALAQDVAMPTLAPWTATGSRPGDEKQAAPLYPAADPSRKKR